MRDTPVNDFYARNGHIREDGKLVHELILAEVKKPSESKARWDYYKVLAPIPHNGHSFHLRKASAAWSRNNRRHSCPWHRTRGKRGHG